MKLRALFLCMLTQAIAIAAPQRLAIDPNEPEKNRPLVSRAEREKLGLTAHTWFGMVQPAVYPHLEKLNATVAAMKERLRRERDLKAFGFLQRVRFEGKVYVEVQVKDAESKRRVLRSLKGSEFHVQQVFDGLAGFAGFVGNEGLRKLASNPDVTGVCLDDKAMPEPPKSIFRNDLPPAPPLDASSKQPGVAEGKVEADVYRALALSDRVNVLINLRRDTLPKASDKPSEMRAEYLSRKQAEKELQDRVLSTVSADEFWFSAGVGPLLTGFVNKEGVDKLWRHPDVVGIGVESLHGLPARNSRKPK